MLSARLVLAFSVRWEPARTAPQHWKAPSTLRSLSIPKRRFRHNFRHTSVEIGRLHPRLKNQPTTDDRRRRQRRRRRRRPPPRRQRRRQPDDDTVSETDDDDGRPRRRRTTNDDDDDHEDDADNEDDDDNDDVPTTTTPTTPPTTTMNKPTATTWSFSKRANCYWENVAAQQALSVKCVKQPT